METKLLIILRHTARISIMDLADAVGENPKTVFLCVTQMLDDGLCKGHLTGSWSKGGEFIAIVPIPSSYIPTTAAPPIDKPVGQQQTNIHVEAGATAIIDSQYTATKSDLITAREVVKKDVEKVRIEHIKPIEATISSVTLQTLQELSRTYKESDDKREKMLDEIETLEADNRSLRRKINKTSEEEQQMDVILKKLDEIGEKITNHDTKMCEEISEMREQINKAASETIEGITLELKQQKSELALEFIEGNKELCKLLEATSMTLNAKLETQKDDIEKISKLLDIDDKNLANIIGILDGQSEDKKQTLKESVISEFKKAVAEVGANPEEIDQLLSKILNKKETLGGRLNSLKNFFGRAKKWLDNNPSVVKALRVLITGATTAMGTPILQF